MVTNKNTSYGNPQSAVSPTSKSDLPPGGIGIEYDRSQLTDWTNGKYIIKKTIPMLSAIGEYSFNSLENILYSTIPGT